MEQPVEVPQACAADGFLMVCRLRTGQSPLDGLKQFRHELLEHQGLLLSKLDAKISKLASLGWGGILRKCGTFSSFFLISNSGPEIIDPLNPGLTLQINQRSSAIAARVPGWWHPMRLRILSWRNSRDPKMRCRVPWCQFLLLPLG